MSVCHYCREPIKPDSRDTYQQIRGWERKGQGESRRGGSDIVLRERVEVFACGRCVFRLQHGLAVGQEAML